MKSLTDRDFEGADLFRLIKDDSSRIFTVYVVLISQTVFYALLYNYLVCVFPGPGGLKRPFLFIINVSSYSGYKLCCHNYTTFPVMFSPIHIKSVSAMNTQHRRVAPMQSSSVICARNSRRANAKPTLLII